MEDSKYIDKVFEEAVSAIDAGDEIALNQILLGNPGITGWRLSEPGSWLKDRVGNAVNGFFKDPYLLWFVAEDPVRNERLPPNIVVITESIITRIKLEAPHTMQEQLDYALRLVAWSTVAKKYNVQLPLIDVLIDAGAIPNYSNDALVNHNFSAAERLILRGAPLNLATALCLGMWDEIPDLASNADAGSKQFSLVLAALNGKSEAVNWLIRNGADLNAPSEDLYSHGTPLHHAVYSGSLDTVKCLVEAGAELNTKDKVFNGTPLGWAEYGKLDTIATYLRHHGAR